MIREINISDSDEMYKLFSRNGYTAPEKKIKGNIKALIDEGCEKVFVETDDAGKVIGYVHIGSYKLLYFKPLANILGLLVDEAHRRRGIGRELIKVAKKWALENKFYGIRVISGNEGEKAHAFYKSLGFRFIKSQGNYRMKLDLKEFALIGLEKDE